MNIILMLAVIIVAAILVVYAVRKNKNAEVEEKVVDEKSYTIDAMM